MIITRRKFLAAAGSAAVVSLGGSVPAFLARAAEQSNSPGGDSILVVVQLSGGNDGLNTVIPYSDENYLKNRPKLAIPTADLLKISDSLGLHPAMRGCADLLEQGKFQIVQGVGYPDPNRSHFESMDIWHTCRRKTQARSDGWLGRYLDAAHREAGGDVPALHLGHEKLPLALVAQDVRAPSISNLEKFRLETQGDDLGRAVKELAAASATESGDELLGFLRTSSASAVAASERVEAARKDYKTSVAWPTTDLAQKLRTVAQLIDAGLKTRIYYVSLDGFDTHSQQPDAHAGLLRQFAEATSALVRDLAEHGHADRVLVASFSEFGRRVAENASDGTDHGAAGPMFLAGGKVKAGVIGAHPSLTDLVDGDLKHHTDFRQVYATALEQWLGAPSEKLLGGKYETLPLFAS